MDTKPSGSVRKPFSQAPLIKYNSVPSSTSAPTLIKTASFAGSDPWGYRVETAYKCKLWLMNEEVDGTTPCEPTSPDAEGPTGTSRYSNEFGNAYGGWSSAGRSSNDDRGSWWDTQGASAGVSESGFRSAYASNATESRASTCGQVPHHPSSDPSALLRRCSLDVTLDKLTASVQLSRQQQGGGGAKRNSRRSLDMLLDEVESPSDVGGAWACSTGVSDAQRFFG